MPTKQFKQFFQANAAHTYLLLVAASLGMIFANVVSKESYDSFFGAQTAGISLHFVINEILMTAFFLLVGLEIKRELFGGELSTIRKAALPLLSAAGGMLAPAAIYWFFSKQDPVASRGWAIPCATDIVFSLAALRLASPVSKRALRIYLSALAVFDDLGGILIIAFFYDTSVTPKYLLLSALLVVVIYGLAKKGLTSPMVYFLLACLLWLSFFWAGIHPTISGAVFAFALPITVSSIPNYASMLAEVEKKLLSFSNFMVLPMFAFANLGLYLADFSMDIALSPPALGTMAGLALGKPLGICVVAFLAVRLGIAALPSRCSWADILGVSCLAGIGFTVSLFVAYLAFDEPNSRNLIGAKIGILAGSMASALLGVAVFRLFGAAKEISRHKTH